METELYPYPCNKLQKQTFYLYKDSVQFFGYVVYYGGCRLYQTAL